MNVVNVSLQVILKVEVGKMYLVVGKVIQYIDSCGVKYENET